VAGLGVRQKIKLFLKVCAAVGYLHRNLVVHRDLKPSNVVVTEDGEPKLLDFGIAKILDLTTDSTMTGIRMLTPEYASPEQLVGGRVSTTSDIYSLAAVLYQLTESRRTNSRTAHWRPNPRSRGGGHTAGEWAPGLKGDLELILMKERKDPQGLCSGTDGGRSGRSRIATDSRAQGGFGISRQETGAEVLGALGDRGADPDEPPGWFVCCQP
jgi:hypothetical protein